MRSLHLTSMTWQRHLRSLWSYAPTEFVRNAARTVPLALAVSAALPGQTEDTDGDE